MIVSKPSPTTEKGKRAFRKHLLDWYDTHKRNLPWRATRDPYRVWISEIMLQQTRVAAVVEYYETFLKRFPTVDVLASAPISAVLTAWSGLGYYRRARMLHEAARKIVNDHEGKFPQTLEGLRSLPGIGRYTAAAISSIAFARPVGVVDGNVERVLQRVRGCKLTSIQLWQTAEEFLSPTRPGDFNQAIMELGATLCLPRQPRCLVCPIRAWCATRGSMEELERKNRRKREIHYALDRRGDSVLLVQRPKDASLMPGMWELPEWSAPNGGAKTWIKLRHSITVTDYLVRVVQHHTPAGRTGKWIACSRLTQLPLTGLTRKILHAAKLI